MAIHTYPCGTVLITIIQFTVLPLGILSQCQQNIKHRKAESNKQGPEANDINVVQKTQLWVTFTQEVFETMPKSTNQLSTSKRNNNVIYCTSQSVYRYILNKRKKHSSSSKIHKLT